MPPTQPALPGLQQDASWERSAIEVIVSWQAARFWTAEVPELGAVGLGASPASSLEELAPAVLREALAAIRLNALDASGVARAILKAHETGSLQTLLDASARVDVDYGLAHG
ncbi:MAG: hypothetical protein DLM64_10545 [Solirubrobacterales bacterium]|nr:MAG: hypothetical protein DLM64_10545 [Solirubrobacterales bacterium]